MCIIVLGVGIVGVIIVYFFCECGYEVVVVECCVEVVVEISVGNVGYVCFLYVMLWVVFGMLVKLLKWLVQSWLGIEVVLCFMLCLDVYQWKWFKIFLVQCMFECYVVNKVCMGCLVCYSYGQLKQICECFDICYEQIIGGNL